MGVLPRSIATAVSRSLQPRKVVVTARAFEETYRRLTGAGLEVVTVPQRRHPGGVLSPEQLIEQAHDAHAILAFMTDSVDRAVLDACPELEVIACALKGFDNFDIQACAERGVAVTAVPDLLTAPTAELAVGLALGLGRRLLEADHEVRSQKFKGWRPTLYGTGLFGAAIGIYGAGAVGRAVAERLKGFAPARLLYVDPVPLDPQVANSLKLERAPSLKEMIQISDFLFVCAPLNASTKHSINAETLHLGKPGMHLINISRGSCVDESAVADSLEAGRISGYAADVFEFEDWILSDRPTAIEERLLAHPRTLFSPHLGSAVESTRREIESAAADEIIRWHNGQDFKYRVN